MTLRTSVSTGRTMIMCVCTDPAEQRPIRGKDGFRDSEGTFMKAYLMRSLCEFRSVAGLAGQIFSGDHDVHGRVVGEQHAVQAISNGLER